MSYFSVKNIYKTWETVTVDFSLECEKGTMTCLLGPSGCGKSTVLNIISGLEKNDADHEALLEIELDGRRIEKLPPRLRGVGMVFQSGALFNHMNVVNNVAYGLISQGMKKKQAIARKPLAGESARELRLPAPLSPSQNLFSWMSRFRPWMQIFAAALPSRFVSGRKKSALLQSWLPTT